MHETLHRSTLLGTCARALLAACALALVTPATPPPAGGPPEAGPVLADDALYEARAERWLARQGFPPAPLPTLEEVQARAFLHLDLGTYEVLLPESALLDEAWLAELQTVTVALLDSQVEWAGWLPEGAAPQAPQAPQASVDATRTGFEPRLAQRRAQVLAKWIRSWTPKSMRRAFPREAATSPREDARFLLDLLDAPAKVRQASAELATSLRRGGSLGGPMLAAPGACPLLLLPTRTDFVEYMATVGLLAERHRPFFWKEGTEFWTFFDYDDTRVLALSFATAEARQHYGRAIPMNRKNANEMAENVVQLASQSLLGRAFGDRMDTVLAGGIANDLVISQFGEADTRTDGDLRSKVIGPRSMFVPGGNPNGGTLPPVDAQSRWRARRGKGYFADVLGEAREAAAKTTRKKEEKLTGFQLLSDDESKDLVVRAPFLGPAATYVPPSEFRGDHAEFLRAYRACFLHWLREEATGRTSREDYGRLLQALASTPEPTDPAAPPVTFGAMLEAVYGAPLSAASTEALFEGGAAPPLEGRFLRWLAKQ